MHVLHASPALDPRKGGTVTALLAMVRANLLQQHRVTVVAMWGGRKPDEYADQLRALGATVHLLGPVRGPIEWHGGIGRVLRGAIPGADVVHVHALWEEIQHRAAVVARGHGVPYVVTPHGMLDPWSMSQRAVKKRIYMALRLRRNLSAAALIHFTTDAERDGAAQLGLKAESFVEPYPIDFSEFQNVPPRTWLRERFPEIGGRKIVLFFGRVHYKKGPELLIRAFAEAKRDDAVLVFAGPVESDYDAQLDRLAQEQGVAGRVFKTGMLYGRDRVAALAGADLFVLPSSQENFGIAVVEALAVHTPVIISDGVNIHPTIARGRVGAVVPTGKVEPLRDALVRWLDDDAMRADAAARARDFVLAEYDIAHAAQRWTRYYERAIESHRAGSRRPAKRPAEVEPLAPRQAP
jgi:glycosyltransferase involved in cell wall biosynthesis